MRATQRASARIADSSRGERHRPLAAGAKLLADPVYDLGAIPIIVHSHLRWDFVWQRPQQVLSRLAAEHPVLFVEEPVDGERHSLAISSTPHGVVRVVPIISHCGEMSADEQCAIILPLLKAALDEHPLLQGRFASAIQWFYSPMTAPAFLGRFGGVGVVYDCMDELANFRFAPADIAAREEFLLSRADVVFTGGHALYRAKSARHPNVHFYGCGVDVDHFAKARAPETAVPDEVACLRHPVLGYFGVIDERLDYPLLARLARDIPEASLAMVGPLAKVRRDELPSLPNIHWLGQRAYGELPSLVKGFDVCLMPFELNASTRYINPTKTLEYLAAGKRVVSTAVPDVVHNFSTVVDVAGSQEDFVAAVQDALSSVDREKIERGIQRARLSSWEAVVASMRRDMLRSIRRPDIVLARPAVAGFDRATATATATAFAMPDLSPPALRIALDGGVGE